MGKLLKIMTYICGIYLKFNLGGLMFDYNISLNRKLLTLSFLMLFSTLSLASQEDLETMIENAFEAVSATKYESEGDDELTKKEHQRVKKNITKKIGRHFNRRGDPDDTVEHFNESVEYEDDFYDHATKCKKCNPFINSLLKYTGIDKVPFKKIKSCLIATHCGTNYGVCVMGVATLKGSACYCPSYAGPVWGQSGCL